MICFLPVILLQGNNRKTLYVQRDLPINLRNQLLLGMLRGHRPAFGVSNKRNVLLRFRAQSKPRDFVSGVVTSSVDEQSSLIEKPVRARTDSFLSHSVDSKVCNS